MSELHFAMVCSSNNNRSMESHQALAGAGFHVSSFGTGTNVRLPGPTLTQQNVYAFGTPYRVMSDDLKAKDEHFYASLGILDMLARNANIKRAPERFQDADLSPVDVVVTFEERVYDQATEHLAELRGSMVSTRIVHVLNLDVRDNREESQINSQLVLDLVRQISSVRDYHAQMQEIIDKFETRYGKGLLHSIHFVPHIQATSSLAAATGFAPATVSASGAAPVSSSSSSAAVLSSLPSLSGSTGPTPVSSPLTSPSSPTPMQQ
jgi:RNA polymerase II subunit A C-terminal domain phosphatase SSU72